ncbi:hypothetical protein N7466_010819 [Penicillium verhagenii]|uniref:uncharacterized protein n=1 Tax=Penicillium verhagenii TaxID=1562060 RepID=UPI00254544C7|nr:uncharacterized protein N7466_010819 [Penicillium verhagenii]KAJ5917265.1 hypothetical protein N7466_010819 [Penicillium verhagenii]
MSGVYRFPNRENYYGPTSSLWLQAFPTNSQSGRTLGGSRFAFWYASPIPHSVLNFTKVPRFADRVELDKQS